MEASARILSTSPFPRRLSTSFLLLKTLSAPNPTYKSPQISLRPRPNVSLPSPRSPSPTISASFLSLSTSSSPSPTFQWHHRNIDFNAGAVAENSPSVTVVLLGWLGATPRVMRRYVEMYNSKGYNTVTFVASVGDVLSFDLGRGLQERVGELASRLADWAEEAEADGRERVLVFHTFSNTGWLA